MPAPAISTLILPDPLLAGSGLSMLMSSTTIGDGLSPDVGVPSGFNEGGMMVTQTGEPIANTPISYRVIASGGIWGEGTWANRLTDETVVTDTLPAWRGENDARYSSAPTWPFLAEPSLGSGRMKAAAWCPRLNREMVYHIDSNYIWVAYREVSRDQHQNGDRTNTKGGAWTIERCLRSDQPGIFFGSRGNNDGGFGIETLRDGTMIMLIEMESNVDLAVFMSEDGLLWTPVADNILARFATLGISASPNSIDGFRMAISGDYLCFTFVWTDFADLGGAGIVQYIRTLISSDRGASWVEITSLTSDMRPYELGSNQQWGNRYDITGIDDDAGTFMLFKGLRTSRLTTQVAYRSGLDDWTFDTDLTFTEGAAQQPFGIWAARGPQWIYVFPVTWDPVGNEWHVNMKLIDPRNYAKASGWRETSSILNGQGTYRYMWHNMRFANVGGMYLACHSILIDADADKATPVWSFVTEGDTYFRLGGWDDLPWEERHHPEFKDVVIPYRHQPGKLDSEAGLAPDWKLSIIEWNTWGGQPDPGGADAAANTPWTLPSSANVGLVWNQNSYEIIDTGAGSSLHRVNFTDAAPVYSWMGQLVTADGPCGHMLEVIVRANKETQGIHTLIPRIGVEVEGYDAIGAGGSGHHYQLHFGATQVALWDNNAGAWIVAPVTVTDAAGGWMKYRIGALSQPWKAGGPVDVSLWARSEEVSGSEWVLLGTGRLASGIGGTQLVQWGHLFGQTDTDRESEWRRVAIYGPHDGGATRNITDAWGNTTGGPGNDDKFYDNLRGRAATHDLVYCYDGISSIWGGGGGFEGDEYEGSVSQAYGAHNILTIGSPTTNFRSATPVSGTTHAHLVYDSSQARDSFSNGRFAHEALAVYGLNSEQLVIEYDDLPDFASPNFTHTLDLVRWTGRVVASDGNLMEVDFGATGPDVGEEMSGQGAMAHYMRFTIGTTYYPDQAFKIREAVLTSLGGSSNRAVRIEGDVDLSLVSAGASFIVWSDRGVIFYDEPSHGQFMRLSMANTSTSDLNRHSLGHFTAGTAVELEVPLEWHFTDSEAANTMQFTTLGAKRWAYEAGPAQRVLEARMTGDVQELRQKIRRYLRTFSRYDMFPLTIVLDPDAAIGKTLDPEKFMLGCIKSGAEFTEYGQRYDNVRNRWLPVGDMKIKIYEEV